MLTVMNKPSRASFKSLQIDLNRNKLKPQAAWKRGNQNNNLLYGLEKGRQ